MHFPGHLVVRSQAVCQQLVQLQLIAPVQSIDRLLKPKRCFRTLDNVAKLIRKRRKVPLKR